MKHFLINFFLNIFFILPNWALKVLTLRKEITYKNEVFDYQSMIYISLISWFITKFGFALDMSEFSDEMRKKMANLRIKINNNVAPKKTILTNLHVDLDYQSLRKKLPENIIPAYDGLSFNF